MQYTGSGTSGKMGQYKGTRSKNTVIHNASKYASPTFLGSNPTAPLLSPTAMHGFATQMAGLQTQYAGALALKRNQIANARAQFQLDRQAAFSQAKGEMAGSVNSALDRGIVGSSADMNNRSAVLASLAANRAAALGTKAQTIGAARANAIGALGSFYLGMGQVQAQKGIAQSELAIEQYKADQLSLLNQNYADYQKDILKALQARSRGRQRDLANPNSVANPNNPFYNPSTGSMGFWYPLTPITAGPKPQMRPFYRPVNPMVGGHNPDFHPVP